LSIFQEIMATSKSKYAARKAKSLDKKFRPGSYHDVDKVEHIAGVCYVMGEEEFSLKLVDFLLSKVEFTGNMAVWAGVERGLYLQSAIYKEQGNPELATECIERINSRLEEEKPLNRKVFQRVLNGQMIPRAYEQVENAVDEKSECAWRMGLFKDLLKIREMGGGEEFSAQRADDEIKENMIRLTELAKKYYK